MSTIKYKWDPSGYSRHSDSQLEWAKELINKLQLQGNERILDIGCGDGKVTKLISEYVPEGEVIGIDNSEEMIEYASKKYSKPEYGNLNFIKMDATQIAFEEYFDIVFSNAALHWVVDHIPVLKGIHRSLKQNGKVLVQMGGKGNANSVVEVLNEISRHNKWKQYFKDFTFPYGFHDPQQYLKWLVETGFKVERIELIPKDRVHNDIDEFKGWIRTQWLPYVARIPEHKREEYIDMVADKFIETYPTNGSRIVVRMQRLEYEASKK